MLTDNVTNGPQSVIRSSIQAFLGKPPEQMPSTSWYTLDAVGTVEVALPHAKWRDMPDDRPYWSSIVRVAVEHENYDDVQTEMWKLVHWRVPLKVLIFYDFSEKDTKRKRPYRADPSVGDLKSGQDWLGAKLDLLGDIISKAQGVLTKEDSAYLVIIGMWRETAPVGVGWRFYSWNWSDSAFDELTQA
jgi:hypothetical protein